MQDVYGRGGETGEEFWRKEERQEVGQDSSKVRSAQVIKEKKVLNASSPFLVCTLPELLG